MGIPTPQERLWFGLDLTLGMLFAMASLMLGAAVLILFTYSLLAESEWTAMPLVLYGLLTLVVGVLDISRRAPRRLLAIHGVLSLLVALFIARFAGLLFLPPLTWPWFVVAYGLIGLAFAAWPSLHPTRNGAAAA